MIDGSFYFFVNVMALSFAYYFKHFSEFGVAFFRTVLSLNIIYDLLMWYFSSNWRTIVKDSCGLEALSTRIRRCQLLFLLRFLQQGDPQEASLLLQHLRPSAFLPWLVFLKQVFRHWSPWSLDSKWPDIGYRPNSFKSNTNHHWQASPPLANSSKE